MLKMVGSKTWALMMEEKNKAIHESIELKSKLDKKAREIEKLNKTIEDLKLEVEEEKEKYKKYVKNMRKKNNAAAKKWLNGYPDE